MFTGLAALTNIGSNLILMPRYGMMGAAIAAVLAYLVMMLSIYFVTRKIYRIEYELNILAGVYLYLFSGILLFYFVDLNLAMRFLIIIGFLMVMLLYSSFRNDIVQTYKRFR